MTTSPTQFVARTRIFTDRDNRFVATPLSVVFLVKNEADRLPGALATVAWADEVLVVDTGSAAATREVSPAARARGVSRPWEGWVASRHPPLEAARHAS